MPYVSQNRSYLRSRMSHRARNSRRSPQRPMLRIERSLKQSSSPKLSTANLRRSRVLRRPPSTLERRPRHRPGPRDLRRLPIRLAFKVERRGGTLLALHWLWLVRPLLISSDRLGNVSPVFSIISSGSQVLVSMCILLNLTRKARQIYVRTQPEIA